MSDLGPSEPFSATLSGTACPALPSTRLTPGLRLRPIFSRSLTGLEDGAQEARACVFRSMSMGPPLGTRDPRRSSSGSPQI